MSYSSKIQSLLQKGYSKEDIDYAIIRLRQGVPDHQVVDTLRAMRKMEKEKAILLVRELQTIPHEHKETSELVLVLSWLGGLIMIFLGLAAMKASTGSGIATCISGLGLIIGAVTGAFRQPVKPKKEADKN
jgi:hypothetical protein